MIGKILASVFGSSNDRVIKENMKTVEKINALEDSLSALSDTNLQAKTDEFKSRLSNGEALDDILVEAFAVVREASKRTIGLRHYDVQLLGGIILHQGNITEMRTGEGKTLVATAPIYLHALTGNGTHVVTVNDYLAKRDAEWMGKVYSFLGLSTGVVIPNIDHEERKKAYLCDITYATNNELGFDFLRDNLCLTLEDMVQRKHNFAIVDEVDSILIDEARTPLIISGPAEDSSELYRAINSIIPQIKKEWIEHDEKQKSANLTEEGLQRIEQILEESGILTEGSLYEQQNISLLHHLNVAIRAYFAYEVEKDYIVENGEVVIIDEFSGRKMQGRRYGEGLHQAIECKEGVVIQQENQTLASITFQNYFRMYKTLSGMTGTAMTEAGEFEEIYNLNSVEIPTNIKPKRIDNQDEVYRTAIEKDEAVLRQVQECVSRSQPILLGTGSIDQSEHYSKILSNNKIKHNILNARNHLAEADIIANAGILGAVTIATNMAGRGTDIKLGGINGTDEERLAVLKTGGLYVLGTERHESRRIDNQLRGRSGRQGDEGETKFYLSLEDNLMRIFGSNRIDTMLQKLGLEHGESITHPWVSKALEKAQQKVEGHNFEIRKQLIKYDDVTNDQRKAMFDLRRKYMMAENIFDLADDIRLRTLEETLENNIPENSVPSMWNMEALKQDLKAMFAIEVPIEKWADEEGVNDQDIFTRLKDISDKIVTERRSVDIDIMKDATRSILIQILDANWKEHLLAMDHLRQGIGLRAYGQKDPLREYKSEAYTLFEEFLRHAGVISTQYISHISIDVEETQRPARTPITSSERIPRNAPCTCESGKKYKHCCGVK